MCELASRPIKVSDMTNGDMVHGGQDTTNDWATVYEHREAENGFYWVTVQQRHREGHRKYDVYVKGTDEWIKLHF